MNHALREIYSTYGHIASTTKKSKSLSKFGITRNADNGVKTTIADFQGTVVNETFVTTNIIDHAISTSANDTGIITVEGHTIDGDGNLTFVVQDVTLTGQTKAALATPLARCTRAYVKDGTFASPSVDLQGVVSIYDDTGGQSAGGVPTVAAATKCRIRGDLGDNQSAKAATSISSTDYWIIREIHFGMRRGSGGGSATVADCDIEVRRIGGVWRPVGLEVNLKTTVNVFENVSVFPYVIVRPNSDVRAIITADVNDTIAEARIEGVLATVDSFDYNRTQ
jgi:hypothetical protein